MEYGRQREIFQGDLIQSTIEFTLSLKLKFSNLLKLDILVIELLNNSTDLWSYLYWYESCLIGEDRLDDRLPQKRECIVLPSCYIKMIKDFLIFSLLSQKPKVTIEWMRHAPESPLLLYINLYISILAFTCSADLYTLLLSFTWGTFKNVTGFETESIYSVNKNSNSVMPVWS